MIQIFFVLFTKFRNRKEKENNSENSATLRTHFVCVPCFSELNYNDVSIFPWKIRTLVPARDKADCINFPFLKKRLVNNITQYTILAGCFALR